MRRSKSHAQWARIEKVLTDEMQRAAIASGELRVIHSTKSGRRPSKRSAVPLLEEAQEPGAQCSPEV
jgi:hypothetical protein